MRIGLYHPIPPAYCSYEPEGATVARSLIDLICGRDERLRVEHIGSSEGARPILNRTPRNRVFT